MSSTSDADDEVISGPLYFSHTTQLKAQLRKARNRFVADVSRFKVGKAYRFKQDPACCMYIAEIGPHPLSRLPTAYGLKVNGQGSDGAMVLLEELDLEVVF